MPRVSEETINKLQEFIDSLPDYARNKCALCNETLTHIVKQAEAQTGAGTATVTRELAARIDEGAAPGGRPDGNRLRNRVQYSENIICGNSADKPEQKEVAPEKENYSIAMKYAKMAEMDLKGIHSGHHDWEEALDYIIKWSQNRKNELRG